MVRSHAVYPLAYKGKNNEFFATIWINSNLTLRQGGAYSFMYKGVWNKPLKWYPDRDSNPRNGSLEGYCLNPLGDPDLIFYHINDRMF